MPIYEREENLSRARVPDGTSREDLAIFLAGWRRYRALALREDPGDFLADRRNAGDVQHRLFLAFSAAIGATKWLAGKVGLRGRPRGFADAFDLLVQAGALPAGKRPVYIGLARLRNWITHEAVSLPPARTRALLRFYLPELEAFAACLRRHRR